MIYLLYYWTCGVQLLDLAVEGHLLGCDTQLDTGEAFGRLGALQDLIIALGLN